MGFENQSVQPVEVVVGGPLPRAGYVQPVEVISGGGQPGFTWTLVGSGELALNSGVSSDVVTDVDPVSPGVVYLATVSPTDANVTGKAICQGNTLVAPPANTIFYSLIAASAGHISLRVRSNAGTPVVVAFALWKGTP